MRTGKPEQFVALALGTFDGHGSFTQVDNSHGLSGTGVDRPGSGTYTVNPDCTGSLTLWNEGLPFPIQTRIVVFDKGAETRGIVMSPAVIVADDHEPQGVLDARASSYPLSNRLLGSAHGRWQPLPLATEEP